MAKIKLFLLFVVWPFSNKSIINFLDQHQHYGEHQHQRCVGGAVTDCGQRANLAKRLAAHKASANAAAGPVADEGATMGPISPLDVSLDPEIVMTKSLQL